jgi:hypothetical protein
MYYAMGYQEGDYTRNRRHFDNIRSLRIEVLADGK